MTEQISFRIIVGIILIAISYTTIGCVTNFKNTSKDNSYTLCKEPRPEICTREYAPVCGKLIDGSQRIYSTGCSACADKKIIGYKSNPCQ